MKTLKRKSLYGSIIVMIILCIGIQAYAVNGNDEEWEVETSAVSEFIEEENVSEEFITYLESGSTSAERPTIQDYTYLGESYANLASAQNSGLLPDSYDLRTDGLVTPVVNQESLGVCWAIAVSEALTSNIIEQFPQESISSLPIAYFTYTNDDMLEFYWGEYDSYMDGGSEAHTIATLANWSGPILNSTYFSDYVVGADVPETYRFDAEYHLQAAYYMPVGLCYELEDDVSGNVEVMQSIIREGLPITVLYSALREESYYNEETYAHNNSEWDFADHEVLIIGWDDNYPKENFADEAQPENDGAWLIQNSWGTDWGDEGCFWLSYEDPTIYIGAVYVLEEADNYTTNYGYDLTGWNYSVATSTDKPTEATAANIFTPEGNEQLEAVSFYTTDTLVDYTISIYTGLEDKDDPTSGTEQLTQTGRESYTGYHTIELTDTIALEEGELFSIVVTFKNPTHEAPLAIEMYFMEEGVTEPTYLGNGGESYVLIGDEWKDIAGVSDALYDNFGTDVYITNVCIKGFTNPLPASNTAVSTVTFSEMEGPIADGTTITLEADAGETIYYKIDDGNFSVYSSGIKGFFSDTVSEHTITAYAVDADGNKGNTRTKTYTQASAQLVNLAVDSGTASTYLETDENGYEETQSITVSSGVETTQIMAQSSDTITIYNVADDDTETEIDWESDGLWSESIDVKEGKSILLDVEVSGTGKTSTTYTIEIIGSVIDVDWANEIITYDEEKYKVTDKNSNVIKSGGSITYLITTTDTTILTVTESVTDSQGEIFTYTEELPARSDLSSAAAINYEAETTASGFSDFCYYSSNADMSNATQCEYGEYIALTPGEDIYIQRSAVEDVSFASTIAHVVVPNRPATPVIEIAEQTSTTITVEEIDGAVYRIEGGDWQGETEFTGLTGETTYLIEAKLSATDSSFASAVGSLEVTTLTSSDSSDEPSSYTDGTITITGDIEEGAILYVTELLESDEGYSLLIEEAGDNEIIWLKEISLRYEDGTVCSYNGTLKLRISVPEVEDTSNLVLLHYTVDGTIEKLVNETTDAGYFETTLTSLSPFALINTTTDDVVTQTTTTSGTVAGDSEADTGDDTSAIQWVILLSIALIGVCGLVFYIKRKNKK